MPSTRTVPSCRAASIPVVPPPLLETARNSQVPATLGIAGFPVIDLPSEQLTRTTDKPNRNIAEIARIILPATPYDAECKRGIMALEKTA